MNNLRIAQLITGLLFIGLSVALLYKHDMQLPVPIVTIRALICTGVGVVFILRALR